MEDTSDIITKLYAIRAGLCVLAGEKEKFDCIAGNAEKSRDGRLKNANSALETARKKAEDEQYSYEISKSEVSSDKSYRRAILLNFFIAILWALLSVVLVCVLLALVAATLYLIFLVLCSLVLYIFKIDDPEWFNTLYYWYNEYIFSKLSEGWQIAVFILAPLVSGGLTVADGYLMYYLFIDEKLITKKLGRAFRRLKRSFWAIFITPLDKRKRKKALRAMNSANIRYESLQEKFNSTREEIEAEFLREMEQANDIADNSMLFYDTLVKIYNDFLDVRDWTYIDYIIYTLETRRADTLKESLQLTDREMQTRRIMETMQNATKMICETIQTNADQIKEELKQNFDKIHDQIIEESNKMQGQLGNISASIEKLGQNMQISQAAQLTYLAQISSQNNMMNEFMKRNGTSSQELVSAVNGLRNDYRRVNNPC